jgi:ATP-dependent Lon protease
MKILYPHGEASIEEQEELLSFAMELRRRVREHILRIDETFVRHDFVYKRKSDEKSVTVLTPEELQYPAFAAPKHLAKPEENDGDQDDGSKETGTDLGSTAENNEASTAKAASKADEKFVPPCGGRNDSHHPDLAYQINLSVASDR